MTDDLDVVQQAKQRIHEAIQASAPADEDLEGNVLIGWLAIAEWMDSDGKRWLSRVGAPANPTEMLPDWQREGYLHNALHGYWGEDEDWDDE